MKKIVLALFAFIAVVSCVKDPWKEINTGKWNHEHSILSIKLEGQVGEAVIENTDLQKGVIKLELVPYIINDMASVKVESMELSLDATATVAVNGTLDFSNGNRPNVEVVSVNGDKRVYAFEAVEFEETLLGNYKITGSMVLGGTGHVYGGAGLMSPESKSWIWAERGGYGPTAEYDNYLKFELTEFTPEGNTKGTCTHYAGADGKFWNCIFAAKYNKEGLTDIDLHDRYRNIPMGVSTWERNYAANTLTFTDGEGKVTVSRMFDSGDHTVLAESGQGKAKVLTVADQAFGFELKGTDDWTNIYGDYDKFAKKTLAHFVLVEKVEAIPAASMTEGEEGDITIKEPDPPAPADNLSGTYSLANYYAFSYPKDKSKVALMSPQEKDWDFNNVKKQNDNKLILTATTTVNGNEKGEADYTPGADNTYWDYTWKAGKCKHTADAVDASEIYGFLPHGKSEYIYDKTNQKITFTQGDYSVTLDFLPAGKYTYTVEGASNTKELNVPNMAFSFPMPAAYLEMFKAVPESWSDSDWLLYWVKNYIMSFSKD